MAQRHVAAMTQHPTDLPRHMVVVDVHVVIPPARSLSSTTNVAAAGLQVVGLSLGYPVAANVVTLQYFDFVFRLSIAKILFALARAKSVFT